jgi:hypothetical protein
MALEKTDGAFVAVRRGISQCSTFRGFCEFHDRELFLPIEAVPIVPTCEQAFLFGYRALCREYYAKIRRFENFKAWPNFAASAMPTVGPHIKAIVEAEGRALRVGMNHIEQFKRRWDDFLMRGDWSSVRYWSAHLESIPRIMCSGAFIPELDLDGNVLQRLTLDGPPYEPLALTITASNGRGLVLFTWLSSPAGVCERFVSLLSQLSFDSIGEEIASLAAMKIENLYFAPDWWEQIDDPTRSYFGKAALSGTVLERPVNRIGGRLSTAIPWKTADVHTNMNS